MTERKPVRTSYNDRTRCYDEVIVPDPPTQVRFVYWEHAEHTVVTARYQGDDPLASPRSFEYQVYPRLDDPEQQIRRAIEAAHILVGLQVQNQTRNV